MSELNLEHLHSFTRPSTALDTGLNWVNNLQPGWYHVPVWGLDMWELGDFPRVNVAHLNESGRRVYAAATYDEGGIEVRAFTHRAERDAATDEIAAQYWRLGAQGPFDLPPEGEPLLAHHRGKFTWGRYIAEKDQLPTSRGELQ